MKENEEQSYLDMIKEGLVEFGKTQKPETPVDKVLEYPGKGQLRIDAEITQTADVLERMYKQEQAEDLETEAAGEDKSQQPPDMYEDIKKKEMAGMEELAGQKDNTNNEITPSEPNESTSLIEQLFTESEDDDEDFLIESLLEEEIEELEAKQDKETSVSDTGVKELPNVPDDVKDEIVTKDNQEEEASLIEQLLNEEDEEEDEEDEEDEEPAGETPEEPAGDSEDEEKEVLEVEPKEEVGGANIDQEIEKLEAPEVEKPAEEEEVEEADEVLAPDVKPEDAMEEVPEPEEEPAEIEDLEKDTIEDSFNALFEMEDEEEEEPAVTGPGGHVPDGTGPHGRGMGPGGGKGDGSGMAAAKDEEEAEEEVEESQELQEIEEALNALFEAEETEDEEKEETEDEEKEETEDEEKEETEDEEKEEFVARKAVEESVIDRLIRELDNSVITESEDELDLFDFDDNE